MRHGRFTGNVIESNGRYGISIGHKDTDNEFVENTVARNGISGVYFREETFANSGHRNTFRRNKVLDNGGPREGYGFYIQPQATDNVIENNQIADTRTAGRTQRFGVYKAAGAGVVRLTDNQMSGQEADYRDAAAHRQDGRAHPCTCSLPALYFRRLWSCGPDRLNEGDPALLCRHALLIAAGPQRGWKTRLRNDPDTVVMQLNFVLENPDHWTRMSWTRMLTSLSEAGHASLDDWSTERDRRLNNQIEYFLKTGKMLKNAG